MTHYILITLIYVNDICFGLYLISDNGRQITRTLRERQFSFSIKPQRPCVVTGEANCKSIHNSFAYAIYYFQTKFVFSTVIMVYYFVIMSILVHILTAYILLCINK